MEKYTTPELLRIDDALCGARQRWVAVPAVVADIDALIEKTARMVGQAGQRKAAERNVEALYGLQEPFISRVLDEMGTAALSDDAVGKLAEMHLAAERRKSAQLERDAKGYRGR